MIFRHFTLVSNETRCASCFLIRHDGTARQALCEILSNVTIIHDFEAIPCGAVSMIARPKIGWVCVRQASSACTRVNDTHLSKNKSGS